MNLKSDALSINNIATFKCGDIEVILSDNINAIKPVWYDLQQQCSHTIYQHYLWQKAWLETLGVAQKAKPLFITGSLDNTPVFLIPLIVTKTMGLSVATWMGGKHANYRFGFFAPQQIEVIRQIMPNLLNDISNNAPYPLDVFELTQQPLKWDDFDNPMAILPSSQSSISGGSVTLEPDFNNVLARGNAKRKHKILRSQERSLAKLGGYEYLRTQNENEHNTLYDVFLSQKKQWFAERGIKNEFVDATTAAFFNQLAKYNEMMEKGESLIEFDYIFADGQHLSLLAGGTLEGQHFGYFTSMSNDQKYKTISPGSLVFYKCIESSCHENMRRFDFGVGAERYKDSWAGESHTLFDVIIPISFKGQFYMASHKLKSNMKRMIKKNETLWTLVKSARRLLARGRIT
ncbi:MAG: GNAT family N-acetyltransferase [Hyphomicrobiales bacterium]